MAAIVSSSVCNPPCWGLYFPKMVTPINMPTHKLFFRCDFDRPLLTGGSGGGGAVCVPSP